MTNTSDDDKSIKWHKYETGSSLDVIYLSELFLDLPREIERLSNGVETAYIHGKHYRFTVVKVDYWGNSWSDIPWDEMQPYLEDASAGRTPPETEVRYIKVEELSDDEAERLYNKLNSELLNDSNQNSSSEDIKIISLNEGMRILYIRSYVLFVPRYLINDNTKCAYELMDKYGEKLVFVRRQDIDMDSLKSIEADKAIIDEYDRVVHSYPMGSNIRLEHYRAFKKTAYGALDVAFMHNLPFCSPLSFSIGDFKNGKAEIGFTVSDANSITWLYGVINNKAQVVSKFTYKENGDEQPQIPVMPKECKDKEEKRKTTKTMRILYLTRLKRMKMKSVTPP